jgi:hypothetical protein
MPIICCAAAIIAWGDEDAIMRRVAEHRSAGADRVCVPVLLADQTAFPREQWRRIAAVCKCDQSQ